jgi:hypothetical protein
MTKTRLGWKVVRKYNGGKLRSATHIWHGCRQYRLRAYTAPKRFCGPLAVFSTARYAYRFSQHACPSTWDMYICRCEYVPSNMDHLWAARSSRSSRDERYNLPAGTRLAAKVKLLSVHGVDHYRKQMRRKK